MSAPDLAVHLRTLPTARRRRLSSGLRALDEAVADAAGLGFDPWQLAVPLAELLAAGLTGGDIRWLVACGLVRHTREQPGADPDRRVFAPATTLALGPTSCFLPATIPGPAVVPPLCVARPRWDAGRRELLWVGRVVKRFRVPAPSQEKILAAFEEDGWPARIDSPLTPDARPGSGRRLHDAVRDLNRGQAPPPVRFFRDGRGEGVCWAAPAADRHRSGTGPAPGPG